MTRSRDLIGSLSLLVGIAIEAANWTRAIPPPLLGCGESGSDAKVWEPVQWFPSDAAKRLTFR